MEGSVRHLVLYLSDRIPLFSLLASLWYWQSCWQMCWQSSCWEGSLGCVCVCVMFLSNHRLVFLSSAARSQPDLFVLLHAAYQPFGEWAELWHLYPPTYADTHEQSANGHLGHHFHRWATILHSLCQGSSNLLWPGHNFPVQECLGLCDPEVNHLLPTSLGKMERQAI